MENSIQRAYEKTVAEDGTIELEFKCKRFGQGSAAGGFILALLLLPASCAVTSVVPENIKNADGGALVIWIILSVALWLGVLQFAFKTSHTLTLKPQTGIIFEGMQLPFADISNIGTNSDGSSAYIYVVSQGNEVRLGKYLKPALADAIVAEIKGVSGTTWS